MLVHQSDVRRRHCSRESCETWTSSWLSWLYISLRLLGATAASPGRVRIALCVFLPPWSRGRSTGTFLEWCVPRSKDAEPRGSPRGRLCCNTRLTPSFQREYTLHVPGMLRLPCLTQALARVPPGNIPLIQCGAEGWGQYSLGSLGVPDCHTQHVSS